MHWRITNIEIPHCSLHNELLSCLCKNTFLSIMILHLLSRFSCITQVHVKRGIKVTAARKSLIVQATCNWNTSSSFKCSKISQQVFQSFSNQGDSVWFCYSLQRSWHFRSKWNLVIQEKGMNFQKLPFTKQRFCNTKQAHRNILLLTEIP